MGHNGGESLPESERTEGGEKGGDGQIKGKGKRSGEQLGPSGSMLFFIGEQPLRISEKSRWGKKKIL